MRTEEQILQGMDLASFMSRCYLDIGFWAERVFGLDIQPFHKEWLNIIMKNRFINIWAFRGSGKTKIFGQVYPLWLCHFKQGSEIMILASELTQSKKTLGEIKSEIQDNWLLKQLMPDDRMVTWSKTEIQTTTKCKIFCKAFNEHVKGNHVDYVFCDEVQDYVDHNIFRTAVAPTINHKRGKIATVGTPDNPVDLLSELSHNPQYVHKKYKILIEHEDGTYESVWPSKFPMKEIEGLRKRDGEASFQTQYLLNANAQVENAVYPPEFVSNCFNHDIEFSGKSHEDSIVVIGADFAISSGAKADFDAYAVVEKVSGKTVLIHGERHKGFPKDAKVQRLRYLYELYKPRKIILDPSSIGEAVFQDLRNYGMPVYAAEFHARARNKLLVNLVTMIHPNEKGVSQLVIPRQPDSEITMTFTNVLVNELINFKEKKNTATGMTSLQSVGAHDDTVMALAMACQGISEQRECLDMLAF